MTRAKISEYSATANDNTDVNGINIAEGCPPSSMNNMGREIMAALKRFQVGSDGDGVTVGGSLVVSGSTSVNTFNVDVISEKTSAAGVTVDGVLLKDSGVVTGAGTVSAPVYSTTGDLNTGIFFPAADTIAFAEGGAEAMRIDSSGNVGIGTTSPSVRLNVTDSADGGNSGTIRLGSDGTYYAQHQFRYNSSEYRFGTYGAGQFMSLYTAGTEHARITSGGDLLVGATTLPSPAGPASKMFLVSNAGNDGSWTGTFQGTGASINRGVVVSYPNSSPNDSGNQPFYFIDGTTARFIIRSNGGVENYSANNVNISDRREKTNFAPAKNYLDTICSIPVQTFNYIDQNNEDDPGLTLGVVAQDVQEVAPELVMESNWGTEEEPKMRLSIYQTDLQYALMKSIQELKAINDAQASRIETLEAKVAALEAR